ncbi:dTDP-4-dehydrorhamnose reductase [Thermocrinis sp.]
MKKLKFLITGAKGQLAKEFIKKFSSKSIDFVMLSKEELNISDTKSVFKVIRDIKPNVVINCAAYNLVDRAESFPAEAIAVNTLGVANLAYACAENKALLIHYSTDYLFDGNKQGLYTEEDQPNPPNEYGKSKLYGELAIKSILEDYLIFRVSWVYGEGKQNFIHRLLQWAKEKEVLQIAFNEVSVPTYTGFIVEKTLKALEKGLSGLYHLVPRGYASRYEWAKLALKLFGINKVLIPVQKEIFNLPAKRPDFSAMSSDRIERELGDEFDEWDGIYSRVYKTLGGLT